MQQCMAELEKSGYGWFTVAHIFFFWGGGKVGGVAHLTRNNVALQKYFFFLTVGTGLN